MLDVEQKIKDLPFWKQDPILNPIKGGRTNQNYKVVDGEKHYFVRYGENIPAHFVDRANERKMIQIMSNHKISPFQHYAENGFIICDFIDGITLTLKNAKHRKNICDIAGLLKKLHTIPKDIVDHSSLIKFDLKKIMKSYFKNIYLKIAPEIKKKIKYIIQTVPVYSFNHLVHTDLIPENFIRDKDRFWLVDWEYGGKGIPAIDLASVITNFDLSPEESQILVLHHGLCDMKQVKQFIPILLVREYLWVLNQINMTGYVGDLSEYEKLCQKRLKNLS